MPAGVSRERTHGEPRDGEGSHECQHGHEDLSAWARRSVGDNRRFGGGLWNRSKRPRFYERRGWRAVSARLDDGPRSQSVGAPNWSMCSVGVPRGRAGREPPHIGDRKPCTGIWCGFTCRGNPFGRFGFRRRGSEAGGPAVQRAGYDGNVRKCRERRDGEPGFRHRCFTPSWGTRSKAQRWALRNWRGSPCGRLRPRRITGDARERVWGWEFRCQTVSVLHQAVKGSQRCSEEVPPTLLLRCSP